MLRLRRARRGPRRRAAFRERLAEWPEDDLVRFAAYLERYNAGAEGIGAD